MSESVNKNVNDHSGAGFLVSVAKYSISSVISIVIMALYIILTGLFIPKEIKGEIELFTGWTNTIMTIAILGMDKALIRFYLRPPSKLSHNGLFRLCFYFSSAVLLIVGTVCSTFFQLPIYKAIGFETTGIYVVPLLFFNAFFYMIARYFNVLYRMEGNIALYTIESILMQFFFKLFYISGFFIDRKNPITAMIICSVAGMGGFALVFAILRRSVLKPSAAEFKSGAYKTILPYALEIAPTAVLLTSNASIISSYISNVAGSASLGIYGFALSLSNIVTVIQGGFASFWGPYMFANYKSQQQRIKSVHDYINLVILVFFCFLVAFEDIAFIVFKEFSEGITIFPLMMLSAVFTILCETTVYGNEIARRPILDTIGFGISLLINVGLCIVLVGPFGLYGAAAAHAAGNFAMFLFRTVTAQRFYKSISNPFKTACAVALAIALAVLGTVFAFNFIIKLLISAVFAVIYSIMYRKELVSLIMLIPQFLAKLFRKDKK